MLQAKKVSLSPESIFAILYMVSFLCEMTEKWLYPSFAWFFLILINILIFTRITRLKFLIFLVSSTAYILFFRFPEVANHVNLFLILNFALITGLLCSGRRTTTDHPYFETIQPLLRTGLALVYILAGFHKLNQDFFNPEVSCAGRLLLFRFGPLLTSTVLGIPTVLFIVVGLGIVVGRLWGNAYPDLIHRKRLLLSIIMLFFTVLLGGVLITAHNQLPLTLRTITVLSMACLVIVWELLGGALLAVTQLQGPILLFSWMMHASLALIGFVDFGALAFALLFAFVPPAYLKRFNQDSHLQVGAYQFHRVYAYVGILILGGMLAGLHYRLDIDLGDIKFLSGFLFNLAATIVLWPIFKVLFSSQHIPWQGVPLWTKQVPPFMGLFTLLILFHGMTPYLGLRTAGNFSMFSNLSTEGSVSNHLLLSSNPLKFWGYQEDVVEVIDIDDKAAKIGHKYRPLKGYRLPVVEFQKLIHKWKKANYTVPIMFVHNNTVYLSQDITQDPTWGTPRSTWETYLMDFRIIQPQGPIECRW